MAVNRADLRTRIRVLADMENTQFVTDSILNAWINIALEEMWDRITMAYQDHFIDKQDFTLAGGPGTGSQHTLPTGVKHLRMLEKSPDLPQRRVVPRWELGEKDDRLGLAYRLVGAVIQIEPFERAAGCYRILYVPAAQQLADDATALDARVDQWADFVVFRCAIKARTREESDTADLRADMAMLMERIDRMSSARDAANPPKCNIVREVWDENGCDDGEEPPPPPES